MYLLCSSQSTGNGGCPLTLLHNATQRLEHLGFVLWIANCETSLGRDTMMGLMVSLGSEVSSDVPC